MTQKKTSKVSNKNFKELSIQVSLNGLSFCILDSANEKVLAMEEFLFDTPKNPESLVGELKQLFLLDDLKDQEFHSIRIIHDNELSAFVPKPLFSESNLADYLKYHVKILENDYINYDELREYEMFNVYIPFTNINNYIYDNYGSFEYKHSATVLIETLLKKHRKEKQEAVYVNINKNYIEIVVTRANKLLLFNTFPFHAPADFIYYLLFVMEQLELNPENTPVTLLGAIQPDDELYQLAWKYIRNISIGDSMNSYRMDKYIEPSLYHRKNLTLLNSFS